ncbi:MAG: hypothetical protein GY703_07940 [Gammaproteobacteria bacterium]|nr:hypothetical protein [Gammaproteobacteria bacterium]
MRTVLDWIKFARKQACNEAGISFWPGVMAGIAFSLPVYKPFAPREELPEPVTVDTESLPPVHCNPLENYLSLGWAGKSNTALIETFKQAEKHDASAQYQLGGYFRRGDEIRRIDDEAIC